MVGGDGFNIHPAFIFLAPLLLERFEFLKISFQIGGNEDVIKEEIKERFKSTTARLPTLFIRSTTLCLPLKALFFISFSLAIIQILNILFGA